MMNNIKVTENIVENLQINDSKKTTNNLEDKNETLGRYVIARSYYAGVFAGYLVKYDKANNIAILRHSRRIWRWSGAETLSTLAVKGTRKPDKCKFPCEIEGEHVITSVSEIISCTDVAKKSIQDVEIWGGEIND